MTPIERLVAIDAIQQLKARYFRTMDLRDWDGMAETFAKDALFDFSEGMRITPLGGAPEGPEGPVTRGRAAIIEWVKAAYAETTAVHHGHGHEVVIDGPTAAHGVIALEGWVRGLDRTTRIGRTRGHYHERYVFEDGAWRIAEVKLVPLFAGADG